MKEETQRIIERYLDVVQADPSDLVAQEELHAVALELGISEDEIAAAESAAQAHVTRGRNHIEHALFDDAVREYGAAAVLRPFDRVVRRGLAEALVNRWEAERDAADAALARTLALRCIDDEPKDQAAYSLLRRLERRPPVGRRPAVRLFLLTLTVSAVGVALWLWPHAPMRTPESSPVAAPGGGHLAPHASTSSVPATPKRVTPKQPSSAGASGDVPVQFDDGGKLEGFVFEAVRTRFERYEAGSLSYKVQAELSNNSNRALDVLAVRLDLLAADGSTLETTTKDVLRADGPLHRPGDVLSLSHLFFDKDAGPDAPLPAKLRVSVVDVVTEPASDYPAATEVPLDWVGDRGAFALVTRRRKLRAGSSPMQFGTSKGKTFHEAVLEVENRGASVTHLKVRADWLNGAGQSLGTTERYVVGPMSAPLPAGRTRLYRLIGTPDGRAERFTLTVIDVK